MSSLEDRISGETMSDNTQNYAQCKNCVYRNKDNYQRYYCDMYTKDDGGKPDELLLNKADCEKRKVEGGRLGEASDKML